MFILKRQDVDIRTVQHPRKDQQIPILSYQGQTFRLLSVFKAAQEDDARALWRDLTDNRGKACVLLEEPERFSIWGKVRLDQLGISSKGAKAGKAQENEIQVKGCLLLLQVLFIDVEDLLGGKQAKQFENDISTVFREWQFPQTDTAKEIHTWLTVDPFTLPQFPDWQDHHLHRLLEATHRIGKDYFGNANFTGRAMEALDDLDKEERSLFLSWLQNSPAGKLWIQ
jgi:hypothetical protein